MDFKNVPKKYRPIPFWSWNEKLVTAETAEQVCAMNDAGIGGFFMHARGGLQTEYMSGEWFENVEAATLEAEKHGMYSWAYDENGWPSGFGSGYVNGLGVEYQQKYLRMESNPEHNDTAICKNGEHYFYYDINPFYVDTLDKNVIKEFINCTYEPYYKKFRNRITGFFTDEPQISRNGIPWSFVFESEYKSRFKDNLYEHLEELFLPVNNYKDTRKKFWKMVTDLFSNSFCKQIYDWCEEKGLQLTGHLVLEETLETQLVTNGACMPHYEYFHMPGMDWLGRSVRECLTARQVSSVAEQLGKDFVLSETFASCGHNVSMAELKGIYEWQMVRGINMLCPHLEGYSMRGIRKRDYPPAMYRQQPWWNDFDKWVEAMSRVGMILSKGEKYVDVLLLHPQTTAWTLYDDNENIGLEELNAKFLSVIKELEEKHINFHLGDETIIERHAKVENGKLVIGRQKYNYVITSCCKDFLPVTEKILNEYKTQGGIITTSSELPDTNITDEKSLTYASRKIDGGTVHYFVNTSPYEKAANINIDGRKMDIYTGELCEFDGVHTFEPWGSLMVLEDGTRNIEHAEKSETPIYLDGEFKFTKAPLNAITFDKCDYYFDGVLQERNGYVLNVCQRATELERKVKIHMDYNVKVDFIPERLELVCETPERFKISVNGKWIKKTVQGYFMDKSFKRIDITEYLRLGENVISFDCDFEQSESVYENIKKAWKFESERNKLNYDMEIEAIYLIGDFSVRTDGKWTKLERKAVHYEGDFVIDKPKTYITLSNIEQQGFPFFCGEMTVSGQIEVCGINPVLQLGMKGINVVEVEIDKICKTVLTDNKLSLDGLEKGKHNITLKLKNNLRNLLGPHHCGEGECVGVGVGTFYKERCIWRHIEDTKWNPNYCFVETGIFE